MDPPWVCRSCLDGNHLDCDWWRGCECVIRWGREFGVIVVCESLLPFDYPGD